MSVESDDELDLDRQLEEMKEAEILLKKKTKAKELIIRLTSADAHKKNRKTFLIKAFIKWAKALPLYQKCDELAKQLQERTTVIQSLRESYLRDVVNVKYHLEKVKEYSETAGSHRPSSGASSSSSSSSSNTDSSTAIAKDMYDLHSMPSASVNKLIKKAIASPECTSEYLKEVLTSIGIINAKTGNDMFPWESSHAFVRSMRQSRGISYKLPSIAGETVHLAAPSSQRLYVKYCHDCIGIMTFIRSWNSEVEEALKANVDGRSVEHSLLSLKNTIISLNDVVFNQQAENEELKSEMLRMRRTNTWMGNWSDGQEIKTKVVEMQMDIDRWKNIAYMKDAELDTVKYELKQKALQDLYIQKQIEYKLNEKVNREMIERSIEKAGALEYLTQINKVGSIIKGKDAKIEELETIILEKNRTISSMNDSITQYIKAIDSLNKVITESQISYQHLLVTTTSTAEDLREQNRNITVEYELTEQKLDEVFDNLKKAKETIALQERLAAKAQLENVELLQLREIERVALDKHNAWLASRPKYSLKVVSLCVIYCNRLSRMIANGTVAPRVTLKKGIVYYQSIIATLTETSQQIQDKLQLRVDEMQVDLIVKTRELDNMIHTAATTSRLMETYSKQESDLKERLKTALTQCKELQVSTEDMKRSVKKKDVTIDALTSKVYQLSIVSNTYRYHMNTLLALLKRVRNQIHYHMDKDNNILHNKGVIPARLCNTNGLEGAEATAYLADRRYQISNRLALVTNELMQWIRSKNSVQFNASTVVSSIRKGKVKAAKQAIYHEMCDDIHTVEAIERLMFDDVSRTKALLCDLYHTIIDDNITISSLRDSLARRDDEYNALVAVREKEIQIKNNKKLERHAKKRMYDERQCVKGDGMYQQQQRHHRHGDNHEQHHTSLVTLSPHHHIAVDTSTLKPSVAAAPVKHTIRPKKAKEKSSHVASSHAGNSTGIGSVNSASGSNDSTAVGRNVSINSIAPAAAAVTHSAIATVVDTVAPTNAAPVADVAVDAVAVVAERNEIAIANAALGTDVPTIDGSAIQYNTVAPGTEEDRVTVEHAVVEGGRVNAVDVDKEEDVYYNDDSVGNDDSEIEEDDEDDESVDSLEEELAATCQERDSAYDLIQQLEDDLTALEGRCDSLEKSCQATNDVLNSSLRSGDELMAANAALKSEILSLQRACELSDNTISLLKDAVTDGYKEKEMEIKQLEQVRRQESIRKDKERMQKLCNSSTQLTCAVCAIRDDDVSVHPLHVNNQIDVINASAIETELVQNRVRYRDDMEMPPTILLATARDINASSLKHRHSMSDSTKAYNYQYDNINNSNRLRHSQSQKKELSRPVNIRAYGDRPVSRDHGAIHLAFKLRDDYSHTVATSAASAVRRPYSAAATSSNREQSSNNQYNYGSAVYDKYKYRNTAVIGGDSLSTEYSSYADRTIVRLPETIKPKQQQTIPVHVTQSTVIDKARILLSR